MQQPEFMLYESVSRGLRQVTDKGVPVKVATGIIAGFLPRSVRPAFFVCCTFLSVLAGAPVASAGEVDVIAAEAFDNGDGTWAISATLRHADTGTDHYADRWEVVSPNGTVLAVRKLLHPHVNEQPFTRSLSEIEIPYEFTWVTIRAHDNVHGYGGAEYRLQLEY